MLRAAVRTVATAVRIAAFAVALACGRSPIELAELAEGSGSGESCSTRLCTTTRGGFNGDLGGLAGADAICDAEYPGSHFYRESRDACAPFEPSDPDHIAGHGDIEAGPCWDCFGWTSASSGPYQPGVVDCSSGYVTMGALVPSPDGYPRSRICEGDEWPLTCCQ
jgi:hypothetical protein